MQASNQNGKQKFKSAYEANHYESFDMFWLSKMKRLEAGAGQGKLLESWSGKTSSERGNRKPL